jgi:hypothetical protein
MTTTVKVTYTFDLTGIDIESIKKELDSKFNVDPQKSIIRMEGDDTSIRET